MYPFAYAIKAVPGQPGRFVAVLLKNVIAESVEYMEPNGRGEPALYGVERISNAMRERHRRKEWGG